jgi:uncharacterized membrane protein (UPF0136 family)
MASIPGMHTILAAALEGKVTISAKAFYIVFAIVTVLGGIMGYVKAKSWISLVSGTVSAGILVTASCLLPERPIVSGAVAICVSVLLAGKFIPDYIHKKAFIPSGLMALLSAVSIVLTLLSMTR